MGSKVALLLFFFFFLAFTKAADAADVRPRSKDVTRVWANQHGRGFSAMKKWPDGSRRVYLQFFSIGDPMGSGYLVTKQVNLVEVKGKAGTFEVRRRAGLWDRMIYQPSRGLTPRRAVKGLVDRLMREMAHPLPL